MIVYHHKFVCKSSENIKNSPFFKVNRLQMHLSCDLIDIIKLVDGEILESIKFTSFAVHFEENMLIFKFIWFDYILKTIEGSDRALLSDGSKTNIVHEVETIILWTVSFIWINTIILIVRDVSYGTYFAAKTIHAQNANINDSFWFVYKIFAY